MGIDVHALQFLIGLAKDKDFGETLTLGRQKLDVPLGRIGKYLDLRLDYKHEEYAEYILKEYFGSTCVESLDNSAYEGADHVADLNVKFSDSLGLGPYDTIIDCGTLEHVYNFPVAINNVIGLLKNGGRIIHVLPANNFSGHGFWQFSPELFYSMYTPQLGFQDVEVYLASLDRHEKVYKVRRPSDGIRVTFVSASRVHVMVSARKKHPTEIINVQQSDYLELWAGNDKNNFESPLRWKGLKKWILYPYYKIYKKNVRGLTSVNPGLIELRSIR